MNFTVFFSMNHVTWIQIFTLSDSSCSIRQVLLPAPHHLKALHRCTRKTRLHSPPREGRGGGAATADTTVVHRGKTDRDQIRVPPQAAMICCRSVESDRGATDLGERREEEHVQASILVGGRSSAHGSVVPGRPAPLHVCRLERSRVGGATEAAGVLPHAHASCGVEALDVAPDHAAARRGGRRADLSGVWRRRAG